MDPISAALAGFAAVQKAVDVIKKAKATVDDVASLGPLLGGYFEAKQKTVAAVAEAKKSGGSSLAQAVQIEMQLLQQRKFEEELKMIFMQTGNVDVWNNIVQRVAESEKQQREAARRARDAAVKKAKKMKEYIEIGIAVTLLVILVPPLIWMFIQGLIYARDQGMFK